MKEKEITTIYDERYYSLLTMKSKELKEFTYKYDDYVGYINTANRPPGKEPFVVGIFVKKKNYKNKNTLLLSKTDIMVLNALFHLYLNEEKENVDTDLYSIHHKILGQSLKNNNMANYSTIISSLKKLKNLYIFLGNKNELHHTSNISYFSQLAVIKVLSAEKWLIQFSLGVFGNSIRNRKRYSNLIPIKFLRCKNISKYYIALAICRYIYINAKKKNRLYSFKLETLLKQINYFDRIGNNSGKSYYDLLRQDGISNKTYILKQFIKTLKEVLNTLSYEKKIKSFKLIDFDTNASVLEYSKYTIELELPPKKYFYWKNV